MSDIAQKARVVRRSSALAALVAALVATFVAADARQGKTPRAPGGRTKAGADARAERTRRRAVAAVLEAADAARKFEDAYEASKVQTAAADALWETDEPSARAIFRRAWEAATEYDADDFNEVNGPGGADPYMFTDARDEVIQAAARRDSRLAEAFLREMLKSAEETSARAERPRSDYEVEMPRHVSREALHRLGLAELLLAQNEPQRAAQMVAPVIREGASPNLLSVLVGLRAQSPAEADALYQSLLARTRADAAADANDVLLLSAYALSPDALTTIDARGSVSLQRIDADGPHAREAPPPGLRAAFYDTAAAVLLRPTPPPAPEDADAAGRQLGLYFAVGRLLPFFERESPRHAPALHARFQSLGADVEAGRRAALAQQLEARLVTSANPTDPLAPLLEASSKLGDDNPRADSIRFTAVQSAAERRMWDRAQSVAETITSPGLRRRAQLLITAQKLLALGEAYSEGEEQDYELAARFVRAAEAPPVALAFGMSRAAALAAKRGKAASAAELLDEAARYAERAALGSGQRVSAFAVLTVAAADIGEARAWEWLRQFTHAADALEDYPGDAVSVTEDDRRELGGDHYQSFRAALSSYDLARVFSAAGRLDLERALGEARGLRGEVARAHALVAAARAALAREAPGGVRGGGEKK